MKLSITSEINDLSGGMAYAFAVDGNIDQFFIKDKVNTNEWDPTNEFRMLPDIKPNNIPTIMNTVIDKILSKDLKTRYILSTGMKVNVFIYAQDFNGNYTIESSKSNPITIQ